MTSSNSQMYNDIMATGSKERPPMLPLENIKLIDVEPEVIHMILNGIGNDIYSIVDTCLNAQEMWLAVKCLQHGDSINI
ncbi:hypothetical protein Tco_0550285 [Tanacetum coccineum]